MKICRKNSSRFLQAAFLIAGLTVSAGFCHAQEPVDLKLAYQTGEQYRVEIQVQHSGQVIITGAGEEAKTQTLPLAVGARLNFYERFVGTQSNQQVVRYYDQSKAEIQLDKGTTISQLADDNKLIVSRINSEKGNGLQTASIIDMLSQSELELIQHPADPLTYINLINREEVSEGDEWSPDRQDLANFLAVDEVFASDLKLKLKSLDSQEAKIYLMGNVQADINDVETKLDVSGIITVDRNRNHVSSVRLNISEQRQPGQIAPGFDGKTKISISISAGESVPQLTQSELANVTRDRKVKRLLKWESETGDLKLQYEPAWKVIASDKQGAVMRYIKDGDLMCQCTLLELEKRPADQPLKLEDFEKHIAKIIQVDETQRVVNASQFTTAHGAQALTVTVYGEEQEVPLNWVYYNLTHRDGRQVTFVFTVEQDLAATVNPVARKVVNGLIFQQAQAIPESRNAQTPATNPTR